jgi:hypothetical protein
MRALSMPPLNRFQRTTHHRTRFRLAIVALGDAQAMVARHLEIDARKETRLGGADGGFGGVGVVLGGDHGRGEPHGVGDRRIDGGRHQRRGTVTGASSRGGCPTMERNNESASRTRACASASSARPFSRRAPASLSSPALPRPPPPDCARASPGSAGR